MSRKKGLNTERTASLFASMALAQKEDIKNLIRDVLMEEVMPEFRSILHDISYRMKSLEDLKTGAGINASRLNLGTHFLDGFVITDNSPVARSIAWSDCNITYKGNTYEIADGNTNKKYVWWDLTTPTDFQATDTKPSITDDDIVICVNDGGTHQLVMGIGRMTPGETIIDGSIGSFELRNNAVTAVKVLDGAILSGKLGSGAVTESKIGSGAVTTGKIGNGAVGGSQIADSAVSSGKIANSAVTNSKIGSGAVDSGKLGSNAVTAGKIANGAINNSSLFATAVVDQDAIAGGAVGTGELINGAVTKSKIGAGAVGTDNLNLATHMLF